jgi:hypothetical protein
VIDVKSIFVRLDVLVVDVTLESLLSDNISGEIPLEALMDATDSPVIRSFLLKLIRSEDLAEPVPVTNCPDCSADL